MTYSSIRREELLFFNGELREIIYTHEPLGYKNPEHPYHVRLQCKSFYGLTQALLAW